MNKIQTTRGLRTVQTQGRTLRRFGMMAFAGLLLAGNGFAGEGDAVAAVEADDWQFAVEGYLWAASVDYETREGTSSYVSLRDLLEDLDMMGFGTAEARKGKFSLLADGAYIGISDSETISENTELGIPKQKLEVEVDGWISTLAGGYTIVKSDTHFMDLIGGARYLHLELDLDVKLKTLDKKASADYSGGVWNGIVGVRGQIDMAPQWFLNYYLDVGTGETSWTAQMLASVGYRMDVFDLIVGYRQTYYQFDKSDKFGKAMEHMSFQGPIVGLRYEF
jgi:hypothetical protein